MEEILDCCVLPVPLSFTTFSIHTPTYLPTHPSTLSFSLCIEECRKVCVRFVFSMQCRVAGCKWLNPSRRARGTCRLGRGDGGTFLSGQPSSCSQGRSIGFVCVATHTGCARTTELKTWLAFLLLPAINMNHIFCNCTSKKS